MQKNIGIKAILQTYINSTLSARQLKLGMRTRRTGRLSAPLCIMTVRWTLRIMRTWKKELLPPAWLLGPHRQLSHPSKQRIRTRLILRGGLRRRRSSRPPWSSVASSTQTLWRCQECQMRRPSRGKAMKRGTPQAKAKKNTIQERRACACSAKL